MHVLSKCPQCGANIPPQTSQCNYCGAYLSQKPAAPVAAPQQPATPPRAMAPAAPPLDLTAAEFGMAGPALPVIACVGVVGLCLLGWSLERPDTFWSRDEAVAVWLGAVPLCALIVGAAWRPTWGRFLIALLLFVVVAVTQVVVLFIRSGRLNDDGLGLGAAVGAVAAVGWLLGSGLHAWIVHSRASAARRVG